MTDDEEDALVERAARAILRQRRRGDASPQRVRGPTADEVLDERVDDLDEWCRLARRARRRVRGVLGVERSEGAPPGSRTESTLEPISSPGFSPHRRSRSHT